MTTKALRQAQEQHAKFLRKMGVHPEQIKERNKERDQTALRKKLIRERLEYPDIVKANREAIRPK